MYAIKLRTDPYDTREALTDTEAVALIAAHTPVGVIAIYTADQEGGAKAGEAAWGMHATVRLHEYAECEDDGSRVTIREAEVNWPAIGGTDVTRATVFGNLIAEAAELAKAVNAHLAALVAA